MADVRDPSVPTPSAPGAPPPKLMSTGVKFAIGCGILATLIILGIVITTVAGGIFLQRKADQCKEGRSSRATSRS